MPVGLVAFELSSFSLASAGRFRARASSEISAAGKLLRKQFSEVLTRARPNNVTTLLFLAALYLVLSRCGPVVSRVGESTFRTLDLHTELLRDLDPVGLHSLKGVYKFFRGLTKVPGPFAHRSSGIVYLIVMGNSKSTAKSEDKQQQQEAAAATSETEVVPKEAHVEKSEPSKKESSQEPHHSKKDGDGSLENPIKFAIIENDIATGDLAILKRHGEDIQNYAIFIHHDKCDPTFPLLLIKGKTKPMSSFDPKSKRHAHPVSAASRIFYGDYDVVAVRKLEPKIDITCHDTLKLIDEIPEIPFSEEDISVIQSAKPGLELSSTVCTNMIAHFYNKLGVLKTEPAKVTPQNLEENLTLSDPRYIKLPKVKEGPVARGDPPFLSKLVNGINPPPDVDPVQLNTILPDLKTGDLVLFSGATSSGAIIKFFDHSEFSHIGIVLRIKYSSSVLIWEASTNKAGLVDIESGTVLKGVELLPLRQKIFSGWYDRVAIRRLTGIDDDKRLQMYEDIMKFHREVQGRPYEKNTTELILSAIDFQEEYLSFLRNTKEDLSSLFCSELVAEAYKRMGLLGDKKLSNEYTPDDFASKNDKINPLKFGKLEKEEYIELKFDYSES